MKSEGSKQLEFRLPRISDNYTDGTRVPNPVSGFTSGSIELAVTDSTNGVFHVIVFNPIFSPEALIALTPRWNNLYEPVGLIERTLNVTPTQRKMLLGVVCRLKI